MKKFLILLNVFLIFNLCGCVPLLLVGGGAFVAKKSNTKNKGIELEVKKAYGEYRYKMYENGDEDILSYEDWVMEQAKDSAKAKEWKKVIQNIESN